LDRRIIQVENWGGIILPFQTFYFWQY